MKKIIFVLLTLSFLSLFLVPTKVLAWDDCPFGMVNDPYPGICGRYIDTDKDGICDHSQPAPEDRNNTTNSKITEEDIHDLISGEELKTKTVSEVAQIYQINATEYAKALTEHYKVTIHPTDSFQFLKDKYGVKLNVAKDIAVSMRVGQQITTPESAESDSKVIKKGYHLFQISLFLIILYSVSHILSKKKIISIVTHRKIWNLLLLITFLISGILGILLVLRINFGITISLPFNILFWHVEAGIAMFVISVFHILWHWAYFKNIFKIKK